MRELEEIRADIDDIDEEIVRLFKRRMDCAVSGFDPKCQSHF